MKSDGECAGVKHLFISQHRMRTVEFYLMCTLTEGDLDPLVSKKIQDVAATFTCTAFQTYVLCM